MRDGSDQVIGFGVGVFYGVLALIIIWALTRVLRGPRKK